MELKTYSDYGDFIRGQFLSDFIMIENMINLILAKNICNDDSKIPGNLSMVAEMRLSHKISTLKKIIKDKPYPFNPRDLIIEINKYKKLRDSFSHCIIHIYKTITTENSKELRLMKLDRLEKEGQQLRLERIFKVEELPKNKQDMIKIQLNLAVIIVNWGAILPPTSSITVEGS